MRRFLCAACLAFILSSNAWALNTSSVTVDVLAKTTSSWNGETLPAYLKGQPEVTILRIVIPPKVKLPLHQHPIINAGVLLKGELTVITKDKRTLHLKAGDPISITYQAILGTLPIAVTRRAPFEIWERSAAMPLVVL